METVFKVVSREPDGKLSSAIITDGVFKIYYPENKSLRRNKLQLLFNTYFFAFDNINDARGFAIDYDFKLHNLEIWKAETGKIFRFKRLEFLTCADDLKTLRDGDFKSKKDLDWLNSTLINLSIPDGTVFCATIKLIEKVH